MKILLPIIAIIVVGMLGIGGWFYWTSSHTKNVTITQSASSSPDTPNSAVAQQQVQTSFTQGIQNSKEISTGSTKIVFPYALQNWGDENKGGQALLHHDSSTGWKVISLGGGAWDISSLVNAGVPESIAKQLVQ